MQARAAARVWYTDRGSAFHLQGEDSKTLCGKRIGGDWYRRDGQANCKRCLKKVSAQ